MEETGTGLRARARPDPAAAPDVAAPDLDLLFARAGEGLLQTTGARAVVALIRGGDGEPRVSACLARGAAPEPPDPALIAALAAEPEPVDLGRGEASPAERRSAERGFGAAVAVGGSGGQPWAVLVLAGPEDPPGAVRPRTLAALGAAGQRLEGPTAVAAAVARLAELDAEVQRLDRLSALGELVAEIAHEVRNPLVSVKTFLQLLPHRIDDPDFRTRFHEVVTEEVRRIERLLDGVLAHARPKAESAPGSRTPVAPAFDAVAQLLVHRALERGVRIEIDIADARIDVPLAADPLRQVVLNLALNAIDASPEGGVVRLRARPVPGGVELSVDDEGAGVPPQQREQVFRPFFTTKAGRSGGIGLAISRRLVDQAGGTLALVDGESGGVSFRVRFQG